MNASYMELGRPETLNEIKALESQFDVFRFLRRTTELFGFRYFLVLRLPGATSLDLGENSIITNWPAAMLTAFDRSKLLRNSPLVAALRRSTIPFAFRYDDLVSGRAGEEAVSAGEIYRQHGFVAGACIPVHDVEGDRACVIFSGDRDPTSHRELVELTMIAIHAFQRLIEVTSNDGRREQVLTDRELDCLAWTAAGKTSADIAAILSLSEHTVNHYLNRAAKKLDTVNRTQAVAKALRRGLIS